jgi:hypothetical protein
MRLPTRRILWISSVLVLAVAVIGVWLFTPPSRITQENYDKIKDGMAREQVTAILGEPDQTIVTGRESALQWTNGPNWITVFFENNRTTEKDMRLAAVWETLTWYVNQGAKKIVDSVN